MTAPADSLIPTKVLSIDHTLSVFSFIIFRFIIDNCNYGSLFRKCIKMKIFLLFTIVYPKINMNIVKTILPQEQFANTHQRKFRFSLAKALGCTSALHNGG